MLDLLSNDFGYYTYVYNFCFNIGIQVTENSISLSNIKGVIYKSFSFKVQFYNVFADCNMNEFRILCVQSVNRGDHFITKI